MNVTDHLMGVGADDDPAVIDGGRPYSYRQLREATARCAAALVSLGLAPGSRVALAGPNSFFWVAGYLAAMSAGLVVVPLPDRQPVESTRRALRRVGCSAVLADRRTLRRLAPAVPAGVAVVTDQALIVPAAARGEVRRDDTGSPSGAGDRDAALMLTSGSTAEPRAVRVTHGNLRANTDSIVEALGLRREDRMLVILPFHYCFGASLLHTHLRVGAAVVLCNSFAYPQTAVEAIEEHGCTGFAGVPSSYQLLLRASSFAERAPATLRMLQVAGGRLPEAVVDEVRAAAPRAELVLMYGQTEATARLSYLPPERLEGKKGSIGRGIPGVELRVLDGSGRPVAPGQVGEIYARGANISPGYFDDPQATASRFTAHGLRTGDLAVVDVDGDLHVVGRREDFIKSWGHRISSGQVEACALHLPDVVHAAAVGVPDDAAGEAVVLYVVPRPGAALTPEDVLARCRTRLARHEIPRAVVFVDALPTTTSGKVAKSRLRELAVGA